MTELASTQGKYVLYLAVLPFYREPCIREIKRRLGSSLDIYAGPHQVERSVKTAIDTMLYTATSTRIIANRFLLQTGHFLAALRADTVILDLNPRSLSVWPILIIRRLLRRRTLVWGHLHPRAGAQSRTAALRRTMRRLANGTVLYGYDSVIPARLELPNSPVWVAPNALYPARDLEATGDSPYTRIIYVGRLVASKKVDLLLRAFASSGLSSLGVVLTLVGDGNELGHLRQLSRDLGVEDHVEFHGQISDVNALTMYYRDAICSVSPGYVGLSLTQSLGFGVPMLISRDEPHAPEIELERFGGVAFFETDSVQSLADALYAAPRTNDQVGRQALSQRVQRSYSAESMADGLIRSLENNTQDLGEDGWPRI